MKDINDNEIVESRKTAASRVVKHKQQTKDSREAKPNKRDKRKNSQASINPTGRPKQEAKITESKRIKILIVGDSQLRNLNNEKMENEHHSVEKKFKPGMKMNETVKLTGEVDSDVIIKRAATNNVASTTPQELCKETTETLRENQINNLKAEIGFSAVFGRKDSYELHAKVSKLNELLAETLPLKGIDLIESNNILFSNLKNDGLYLNDGGIRRYASNLDKFIKYR